MATGRSPFRSARLPLPSADRPRQPGRHRLPGRADRSYADRLALALDLLADTALDALITGESGFAEPPGLMPRLASGEVPALCHRIRY